jgi:hypothetical protein
MMRFKLTTISAALLAAMVGGAPAVLAQSGAASSANSAQVPQPDPSGVNWKGVGIGAGTVAGNVLYIPAKLVYGILGGIGGGAGYALTGGNEQIANTIWRSSLGGDYVLTPDMVAGKRPIHFSGPTQTAQPPSGAANESNDSTAFASASSPIVSPAAPPGSASATTRPIDSGAGPLGSGTALSSEPVGSGARSVPAVGSGTSGATAKSAAPPLSTSIE